MRGGQSGVEKLIVEGWYTGTGRASWVVGSGGDVGSGRARGNWGPVESDLHQMCGLTDGSVGDKLSAGRVLGLY